MVCVQFSQLDPSKKEIVYFKAELCIGRHPVFKLGTVSLRLAVPFLRAWLAQEVAGHGLEQFI